MLKMTRKSLAFILILCLTATCVITGCAGNGRVNAAVSSVYQTPEPPSDESQQGDIIEITESADSAWGIQLTRFGIALEKNREYKLSFEYEANGRDVILKLYKSGNPAICYLESIVSLDQGVGLYSTEFLMEYDDDPNSIFVMELSRSVSDAANIVIKNFDVSPIQEDETPVVSAEVPRIHVDQLGYYYTEKKYAIIISDDPLFVVCDAKTDRQVFNGSASDPVMSYSAGEYVRIADFSNLTAEGEYYIKNSEAKSYIFTINNGNDYRMLADAVLDMLDYQKCGVAIDDGKWSHDECHKEPAYIYGTNIIVDVSGGWHDAGDYSKYVVPTTKTVADILLAYELGYADGDVLDVAQYGLEWLLKMQDIPSGGVYHKVTTEEFCGEIMPDKDMDKLILSPISATATADFAAVTALAARIFADEFGSKLLAASQNAWAWLEANPNYPGFKNPDGIETSEYADDSSLDERYWAACELYRTTGENIYHDYIKSSVTYQGLGWANMGFYGMVSYLGLPSSLIDENTFFRIESSLLDWINQVIKEYNNDPYTISLGLDYPKGSNMDAANNAMLLVFAAEFFGDADYIQPIRDHIHYLLGRNALSQCYVTGFGTRQVLNPHHRLSEVAGKAVPGMMVGGPNDSLGDPIALAMLKGLPPAKAYIDNYFSYSTNDVATYFNSPLFFVLSFLNSR